MAKSRKKNRKRTQESNQGVSQGEREAQAIYVFSEFIGLIKTTVLVIGAIAIAYIVCNFGIYLPIKISAGKETAVKYLVNFLFNANVSIIVSWCVAAGTAGWAIMERKLRYKERGTRDPQLRALQERLDPGRSSSNLDNTGRGENDA